MIEERDLQGWRLVERFRLVLAKVRKELPRNARESHGLRLLQAEEYLSLFLLGLFNPVIESMRGLCQASRLARVQRECSSRVVGLSRFSEAQEVFDTELVERCLRDLVSTSVGQAAAAGGGLPLAAVKIIDSTLWKVLPRMRWATWRHQSVDQQALRLHLKLRVCDQAPVEAKITAGDVCERKALWEMLQPGECYVGDANYGGDYGGLEKMAAAGCDFLVRFRKNAVLHWEREEPLDDAARAAGLKQAGQARLGTQPRAWRVVMIERAGEEPVCLVASSCWAPLSALEVAEFYRQRWKIEHFFRWLKCLVPCRHWFAESPKGVTFQIYLSLIAALLLAQTLGERPNKRMMELLHFFQMGWASEEEATQGILRAAQETRRKRELAAKKAASKKAA